MKTYYVESNAAWFLVKARNERQAYREGVKEFGVGNVKLARLATASEIEYFTQQKGEIGEAE